MRNLLITLVLFSSFGTLAHSQLPYKNFRSEVPERKTEYYASTNLRGGVKMTITAKYEKEFVCYPYPDMRSCGYETHRTYVGILEQSDGKIVAFLPKDPAGKIIDRELIPWVLGISAEAIREDAEYIKTSVEFTDELGQRWVKVSKH